MTRYVKINTPDSISFCLYLTQRAKTVPAGTQKTAAAGTTAHPAPAHTAAGAGTPAKSAGAHEQYTPAADTHAGAKRKAPAVCSAKPIARFTRPVKKNTLIKNKTHA